MSCPFPAYDVTRRATFDSIADVWMKEVDMYSTVDDAVKMVVANKIDMVCYLLLDYYFLIFIGAKSYTFIYYFNIFIDLIIFYTQYFLLV